MLVSNILFNMAGKFLLDLEYLQSYLTSVSMFYLEPHGRVPTSMNMEML